MSDQQMAADHDIVDALARAATEIASADIPGWGNACLDGAAALSRRLTECERLREALKEVKSTARGYLCWCDNSWNHVEHGHQPKCLAASAALTGGTP